MFESSKRTVKARRNTNAIQTLLESLQKYTNAKTDAVLDEIRFLLDVCLHSHDVLDQDVLKRQLKTALHEWLQKFPNTNPLRSSEARSSNKASKNTTRHSQRPLNAPSSPLRRKETKRNALEVRVNETRRRDRVKERIFAKKEEKRKDRRPDWDGNTKVEKIRVFRLDAQSTEPHENRIESKNVRFDENQIRAKASALLQTKHDDPIKCLKMHRPCIHKDRKQMPKRCARTEFRPFRYLVRCKKNLKRHSGSKSVVDAKEDTPLVHSIDALDPESSCWSDHTTILESLVNELCDEIVDCEFKEAFSTYMSLPNFKS